MIAHKPINLAEQIRANSIPIDLGMNAPTISGYFCRSTLRSNVHLGHARPITYALPIEVTNYKDDCDGACKVGNGDTMPHLKEARPIRMIRASHAS